MQSLQMCCKISGYLNRFLCERKEELEIGSILKRVTHSFTLVTLFSCLVTLFLFCNKSVVANKANNTNNSYKGKYYPQYIWFAKFIYIFYI